jgi:hypothetical protein
MRQVPRLCLFAVNHLTIFDVLAESPFFGDKALFNITLFQLKVKMAVKLLFKTYEN